jgi:L,D-peptidoglycan transpeptidase YkuD (ErfK/YbiS/YcfS/YnhG family)
MGPLEAAYTKAGGPGVEGYPTADPVASVNNGSKQPFEKAGGYSSPAGAFFTDAEVRAKYESMGAETGWFGYPTAEETCSLPGGGCKQTYQRGAILWSPATGAHTNLGAIRSKYAETGYENGWLGYPTTDEVPAGNGGVYQLYQRGAILWSPATGAHTNLGAIRSKYAETGYQSGWLGYPTTDEVPAGNGGVYQNYQGGAILWSPGTGPHTTHGGIRVEYTGTGLANGALGYPTSEEVCGLRGGGCYQMYQGGAILWSPATGAHTTHGAIRAVWAGTGFENGALGYPVTDELCSGSNCIQKYQGATITWLNGPTGIHPYDECEALNNGHSNYSSYGASAVSFAIAESYGSSSATFVRCQNTAGVYWPDWITPGTVGMSGFKHPGVASGPTRYDYSPTGDYSVTQAFGLGNPGTSLPYQTLNPYSRWGGNPWTSTYNQYFESAGWVPYDENMWYFATRAQHDYRQGAVINYNRPPDSGITQDAGFAIFLHEDPVPTAGCVALPEANIVDWLQKARSGDRIIMGVRSDLFH